MNTYTYTVEDRLELIIHVEVQVSSLVADRVRALVEDHGDEGHGDVALVIPAVFLCDVVWGGGSVIVGLVEKTGGVDGPNRRSDGPMVGWAGSHMYMIHVYM